MIFNFRQGISQYQKTPPYIQLNSYGGVDMFCDKAIVTLNFCHGTSNYLFQEVQTVPNAWSTFPTFTDVWLYWDIDVQTGQRSFGFTILNPFITKIPDHPTSGQMFFDVVKTKYYVFDGIGWRECIRIIAGNIDSSGTLLPQAWGTQVGLYQSCDAEPIVFDFNNYPIKRYSNSGFEFYNKKTILNFKRNDVDTHQFKHVVNEHGIASEAITKHQCITWGSYNKLAVASSNGAPAFALAEVKHPTNEIINVVTEGFVKDNNLWNWSESPLTSLFVGPNGTLITSPTIDKTYQKVGYIVSPKVVYIDFRDQYLKMVPPKLSPTPTPTLTPSISFTPTLTPSISITPSLTSSLSATPAVTRTVTPSNTKSPTPTPTHTVTRSIQPTVTPTNSISVTASPTVTPTNTVTPTFTPTNTVTPSTTPPPVPLLFAGADNTSICGTQIPLNGQVLAGNPSQYTYLWEQTFGPTVVIANPNSLSTYFTSTTSADRTFRLWANKGQINQAFADINIFGSASDILPSVFSEFKDGKHLFQSATSGAVNEAIFANQPQFSINNYTGGPVTDTNTGITWSLLPFNSAINGFSMNLEQYNGSSWSTLWNTTSFTTAPYYFSTINRTGTYRVTVQVVLGSRPIVAISKLLSGNTYPIYRQGVEVESSLGITGFQAVQGYNNLQTTKFNPSLEKYYVDITNSTDYFASVGFTGVQQEAAFARTVFSMEQVYESDALGITGFTGTKITPNVTIIRSSGISIGN